uniref:Metalloendopeptidase n=1 Tax=Colubraria reticulata TaxID=604273 RepID=A0A330LC19_9CAEN|nr:Meprins-like metalloprotease MB2 [Colubraria reticulata]
MRFCAVLLLLCLGLVRARPQSKLQIQVQKVQTVADPELTSGYFEGDIELPKKRNVIMRDDLLWPNRIVPVQITFDFSTSEWMLIIETMREIESSTAYPSLYGGGLYYCIRFVNVTTQSDYILIWKGNGCHSYVGRQGGAQQLSLGEGCMFKRTIIHELYHALGFWHEQNRSDRDTYVTIHMDNVEPAEMYNFQKRSTNESKTLNTPYDFTSIMHYGPYSFALDKSKPTILPNPGYGVGLSMGQNLGLSRYDVARIQALYSCPVDISHIIRPPDPTMMCTFETSNCELIQDNKDDLDWISKTGATPTYGPYGDHTNGAGYYMYAEADSNCPKTARLLSLIIPAGAYCMEFWVFHHTYQESSYQIRISAMGALEQVWWNVVPNHENAWVRQKYIVDVNERFRFVLQANVANGTQGAIAIDDFILHSHTC